MHRDPQECFVAGLKDAQPVNMFLERFRLRIGSRQIFNVRLKLQHRSSQDGLSLLVNSMTFPDKAVPILFDCLHVSQAQPMYCTLREKVPTPDQYIGWACE